MEQRSRKLMEIERPCIAYQEYIELGNLMFLELESIYSYLSVLCILGIPHYFSLKSPAKTPKVIYCAFDIFFKGFVGLSRDVIGKRMNLGKKDLCSCSLVIPTEGVVIIVCAQCVAVGPDVSQV